MIDSYQLYINKAVRFFLLIDFREREREEGGEGQREK